MQHHTSGWLETNFDKLQVKFDNDRGVYDIIKVKLKIQQCSKIDRKKSRKRTKVRRQGKI